MSNTVSFPGLGLEFSLNRVAFNIPILDRPVYWSGVIITSGLILAVCAGAGGLESVRTISLI